MYQADSLIMRSTRNMIKINVYGFFKFQLKEIPIPFHSFRAYRKAEVKKQTAHASLWHLDTIFSSTTILTSRLPAKLRKTTNYPTKLLPSQAYTKHSSDNLEAFRFHPG